METGTSLYGLGIDFDSYLHQNVYEILAGDGSVKDKYIQLQAEKKSVSIKFELADAKGNLITYEEDWRIVLKNEDIHGRKYDQRMRSRMINKSYTVSVKEIDEKNKCIYVSHISVKQGDREKLREILDKGEGIKLPAKVVSVRSGMVLIDIGGLGIPGYIPIVEWSPCYTTNLYAHAHRDDILEVVVLGKGQLSKSEEKKNFGNWTEKNPYLCSRRVLVKDPWIGISDKLHREDIIIVKCEDKREKNFFGVTKDFPEINIYCFYPETDEGKPRLDIVLGGYYECWIKKVDEEKKILRAKPFRMVDMGEQDAKKQA